MRDRRWDTDVCVVGGGMSGLCAALAAARRGARVVLAHDRPVFGGNASSEIRVGIIGADRCGAVPHARETGLIEEIRLRNLASNPGMDWCLWDLLLYEMAREEPNLTALMNASCLDATLEAGRIAAVTAWQLTTETRHAVHAPVFIDASGDGILAALSGADTRIGREARAEYDEPAAPAVADARTMGMTCYFCARREQTPSAFTPPPWAHVYETDDRLPYGAPGHDARHVVERGGRRFRLGHWWIELGGEADGIHDTEELKHELLRIVLGVWDHIKNRGDHDAGNFRLEWLQFLPGKRESRRILGDYVLNQRDCEKAPVFPDTVAYGGWPMDDHDPRGFYKTAAPTIFHPCASPYGIPYRCLYSRNVPNLMMAGRNISATHMALSSTRVMATCATLGQAAGTAAAMAVARGIAPREVGRSHLRDLQQTLMLEDCHLPGFALEVPPVTRRFALSSSHGDPSVLWNGTDRQVGDRRNCLDLPAGGWVALEAPEPCAVKCLDVVCDSDLSTQIVTMDYAEEYPAGHRALPAGLVSSFRVSVRAGERWEPLATVSKNARRQLRIPIGRSVTGLRLDGFETVGGAAAASVRLFRMSLQ
ncbi:MAG: FAD-dependent oxidoreductase [Lentisphaerae bacterium]|nr:FAD-dependent oxidoreductase [Lentisphaerota bacterium]